ncbi:CAP domain-containing protein [Nocardioides mesophilus]|uniref:CAP domain-containing protein n=1 Tax=Nocardioides mesophilus TaxID=433659 RepID=A0A7G9REN2_9ACTN|nr:CAP domain-containing protein [Nocardioides mesophilus]QNN54057.1 CAP domain-containing protein [Nocardioides mesophilus]
MTAANAWMRHALTTVAAVLATTLVAAGLVMATSSTATASESIATRWTPDTYEKKVRSWINHERAAHGMSQLTFVKCATRTATKWSQHLADTDEFYHQDMGHVLDACNAYYAGETLGRGNISPRRLVHLWMDSPGHRAVLLSKYAQRVGIGSMVDSHGQWLTAANFVKL